MSDHAGADDPGLGRDPHVFVDDLEHLELDPDDRHHLAKVLRVRDGDRITLSDGRGRWRAARFGATVEPASAIVEIPRPQPEITIAFALTKGARPELVVQKLTELGTDRIVPFHGARSVVRWEGDRAIKQIARLRRVAREAAMQCRRCHLPEVTALGEFDDVVALPAVVAADCGGGPLSLARPTVVIGPEGGWSPEERDHFSHTVGLGDHVLRAETAAVTAGALLGALRAGLLRER